MNEILKQLKSTINNIIFFPSAKDAQIDFINAMLKNDKFSPLPNDYCDFLKNTNGITSGVLEFFGTEKIKRADYNYNFPNIVDANEIFKKLDNPLMKNCVLLGYNLLHAIIYDNNEKMYKIVNRNFFTPVKEFSNFNDVLQYILSNLKV